MWFFYNLLPLQRATYLYILKCNGTPNHSGNNTAQGIYNMYFKLFFRIDKAHLARRFWLFKVAQLSGAFLVHIKRVQVGQERHAQAFVYKAHHSFKTAALYLEMPVAW